MASGFLYSKADHETYLFDYGHFFGDAYKKHASQNESEMPPFPPKAQLTNRTYSTPQQFRL